MTKSIIFICKKYNEIIKYINTPIDKYLYCTCSDFCKFDVSMISNRIKRDSHNSSIKK